MNFIASKYIKIITLPLLLSFNFSFAQVKYIVPAKVSVLEKSLEIGFGEVGTLEQSNRNGGDVMKYLKPFGLPEGSPYCAAGQYFTFLKAVELLGLNNDVIPIPKTALANSIFHFSKAKGEKIRFSPKRNDLIIWRKARTKFGHIERIISVEDNGWVRTLAFNVKNDAGQEGVFIKRRNILHPLGRLSLRGLVGFGEQR